MFVKPGTGSSQDDPAKTIALQVRDPLTRRLLPAQGADVPETPFWLCRLRDKDVVKADPPTAPATTAPPAADTAPEHDQATIPAEAGAADAHPGAEHAETPALPSPQPAPPAAEAAASAHPAEEH